VLRLRKGLIGVAVAGLLAAGSLLPGAAIPVAAGSDGQQLALQDVAGYVYSASVFGYNNLCQYRQLGISSWNGPDNGHDYDMSGAWWQDWYGTEGGNQCYYDQITVQENSGWNYSGVWFQTNYLTQYEPPHSQPSNWTTCQVDGGYACTSGENSYG